MSNIGHNFGTVSVANYTAPRMFDLYQQTPNFQNYNQNLPLDMSNIASQHGHVQTNPDVPGHNNYMPNFHGHVQNSANTPFRNPNIPMNVNPYHNVPSVNFNEQNYHTKSPPDRQNHQNRNPSSNQLSVHNSDKKFTHRDGHGHGWGGGGGGSVGVGNSPAISALALLGFLFFLNLIQNSLQNNRMMLTTTTTTTTTNMTTTNTAGGSTTTTFGRSGRERRKRDSDYYSFHSYTPDFIPSHPIRPIQHFLENNESNQPGFLQPIERDSISTFTSPSPKDNDHSHNSQYRDNPVQTQRKSLMPLMKRLKRISTNCFQLFACTLGRGIIKKYGKPTALKLRSIGSQLLPNMHTHWTTKMLRALTNGWKNGRKCTMQYKKCTGGMDWDQWLHTPQNQKK